MIKTLSTAVFAIPAGLFLLQAIQPHGAEAAAQAPVQAAPVSAAHVEWPVPQAPFDATPITPAESAGAPMQDTF